MNKRLLAAVLLVFVAALWAGQTMAKDELSAKERAWLAEHGPIKVGIFNDYPPFGFVDDQGRAAGIAVDYWRALAARLDMNVEFFPAPFQAQLDGLKQGRFDSLSGIFPLAERARFFEFSAPYFTINTRIFVGPKLGGVKGFGDLKGLRVGVVQGDSGQVLAEKSGLAVKTFVGYEDAVVALGRAQVDAIVMDDLVVYYYRAKHGFGKEIVRAGEPVDRGRMTLPVRKEEKVLFGILKKGVALIPPAKVDGIAQKWLK